jgi:hypothetical protein
MLGYTAQVPVFLFRGGPEALQNKCGSSSKPFYEIADPEIDKLTTLAFTNRAAWIKALIDRGPHLVFHIRIPHSKLPNGPF